VSGIGAPYTGGDAWQFWQLRARTSASAQGKAFSPLSSIG
jgi:hypothetical protein